MNRIAVALSLPIGAALLLQANPSQATPVIINSTPYEILYFSGTLTDFLAAFTLPSADFPWYNDSALAQQFAAAAFAVDGNGSLQLVGDSDPSNVSGQIELGPFFYYDTNAFAAFSAPILTTNAFTCDVSNAIDCESESVSWAYVQTAVVPTPAPLPLLGAAAAFSFSRKLRRRVSARKFTF